MILDEAQTTKVTKQDVEKYAQALRSWPFFQVFSDGFDAEDIVKCFRIEVGQEHPRANILEKCTTRYNKLNTAAVDAYIAENVPASAPGRKAKAA